MVRRRASCKVVDIFVGASRVTEKLLFVLNAQVQCGENLIYFRRDSNFVHENIEPVWRGMLGK